VNGESEPENPWPDPALVMVNCLSVLNEPVFVRYRPLLLVLLLNCPCLVPPAIGAAPMPGIPDILLQCTKTIDSEHAKPPATLYRYSLLMTNGETYADALVYFQELLHGDDLAEVERAAMILSCLSFSLDMVDATIENSGHLFEAVFTPSDSHEWICRIVAALFDSVRSAPCLSAQSRTTCFAFALRLLSALCDEAHEFPEWMLGLAAKCISDLGWVLGVSLLGNAPCEFYGPFSEAVMNVCLAHSDHVGVNREGLGFFVTCFEEFESNGTMDAMVFSAQQSALFASFCARGVDGRSTCFRQCNEPLVDCVY
jgi:hypothetical protein